MRTKRLLDCLKLSGPLFQQMSSRSPLAGSGEGKQELGLPHWSLGSIPERLVGGTFGNKEEAGTRDGAAGDSRGHVRAPRVGTRHRVVPLPFPPCQRCP